MELKEKPTRALYRKSFRNIAPIMLYQRLLEIVQRFSKFQKSMKVLPGSWLNYYRVFINLFIQLQTLIRKILSTLWKEKIEEMQVKYLSNQQSQRFHGTLLVFYQTMITKPKWLNWFLKQLRKKNQSF